MARNYFSQNQFDLMRSIRLEQEKQAQQQAIARQQVSDEHPDFTDAQIDMVLNGSLKAAPANQTGYDPNFTIDPNGRYWQFKLPRPQRDYVGEAMTKQDHAAALRQKGFIERNMATLDASDPDDAKKLEDFKSQLDDVNQQLESNGKSSQSSAPQPAVPLGKGTAGEVAPIYKAGGPDSFRALSNGGSVYFGSAAGAPKFSVRPQIQDEPASGTVSANPQPAIQAAPAVPTLSKWSLAKALLTGVNPAAVASNAENLPNDVTLEQPAAPATPFSISPKKIKQYIEAKNQLNTLSGDENTPKPFIDAATQRLGGLENRMTNGPSQFRIGPTTSYGAQSVDSAMNDISGDTTTPTTPQGVRVRNKTTGQTGIQLPSGEIIPDAQ